MATALGRGRGREGGSVLVSTTSHEVQEKCGQGHHVNSVYGEKNTAVKWKNNTNTHLIDAVNIKRLISARTDDKVVAVGHTREIAECRIPARRRRLRSLTAFVNCKCDSKSILQSDTLFIYMISNVLTVEKYLSYSVADENRDSSSLDNICTTLFT